MKESVNSGLVSLKASHKVLLEALHSVGKNANAVQKVTDQDGLEHVQLELAVHAANCGSNVVTHDLRADHGQRLALGRVNLSRHDGRTGLVLGKDKLAETAAGAGSQVTNILCDLEQRASKGVQRTGGLDDGVVGSKDFELVRCGLELGAGQLGDLDSDGLVEALEGVQTSTDSGTTLGKLAQVGQGVLDALNVAVQLSNVTRELLAKGKRGGILEMGTADLDDVLEVVHLLLESITETLQGRKESVLKLHDGGDMHGSGERVVGRSGHIDVVVGVDGLLGAHLAPQDLNGTVGDDFVRVHVGLSAGTGLPNDQGEVVEELALGHFTGGLLDSLTNLRVYSGSASIYSFGMSAKYCLPRPYFMFTVAAALFRTPKALTTASGMRS